MKNLIILHSNAKEDLKLIKSFEKAGKKEKVKVKSHIIGSLENNFTIKEELLYVIKNFTPDFIIYLQEEKQLGNKKYQDFRESILKAAKEEIYAFGHAAYKIALDIIDSKVLFCDFFAVKINDITFFSLPGQYKLSSYIANALIFPEIENL